MGEIRENDSNIAAKGIKRHLQQNASTRPAGNERFLLHCAGSDIQDIAETNLMDTRTGLDTLASKFNEYFSSRNNVVFARYEFRQCIQREDEGIDCWHTRLRMKASTCEFGDQIDSLIRDQSVACCQSSKLRLRLLQVANISLQDTLQTARSLETANRQAAAIENNNYEVDHSPQFSTLGRSYLPPELSNLRRSQRSRRSGNEPEWAKRERKQKSQLSCYRCGELGHRMCEKARGKTCSRCGKKNHFVKACKGNLPGKVNELEETTPHTVTVLRPSRKPKPTAVTKNFSALNHSYQQAMTHEL